ncbi:putative selenate reductase subunit YgfK [Pseudodesulfovibrio senegalensis]|uniref:Putative selenate reductase subunit YgfK n=1 Tax=Pseudodesulfovibrio senegalensis TaxID=1721087 RepID=A0A6N6N5V4_9BACT|nr:putative selenate reductase subunit YgfK [Pseudodesulfovibrio senegalensis]KAB1443128.1 putative selenate reductase subunit YgfK [Pseudodesulfovibrio senegalensis]
MTTDRFHCASLEHMLQWILNDLENGEALGIPQALFLTPDTSDPFRMQRYGRLLETPLGVAAGPHTQMSQNIVAAWLCGARYIELKTIQVLDELDVTKPCIDMTDEGYNCEWSQELKLDQSFNEYLNAHVLMHVLSHRLGREYDPQNPGWIFNMSAGYNLEGILSPGVQRFFDRMEDCSEELGRKIDSIAALYPAVRELDIPARLSDNLTVSTMHGCPPDEVEKIGRYFIEDRGYHTTIKMNPTLLGPDRLRAILNDTLGFEITVPDEAFGHDLKYDQGVSIIKNLTGAAQAKGVEFGLKLTNTLETSNIDQNLPKNEGMVYMSGRALHPISINLAARLQKQFDGQLNISFSAGVDTVNIAGTLACGLRPVTVCSDLLKPGGYGRLSQYAETARTACTELGAKNLDELVTTRAGKKDMAQARMANLDAYAEAVLESGRYAKEEFPYTSIKTGRDLPTFDCAGAPCVTACSAGQDIPRYLDSVARGDYEEAYRTILATNPFPHVQGMVCDHLCQFKCTRMNYDSTLLIREVKRFVAEKCHGKVTMQPASANGKKVAVIGAGPTGLAAAYFLTLEGFEVAIYESKDFPGGMAADGIPAFRLDDGSLKKDIDFILSLGATLHTGQTIDAKAFETLTNENDFVYVAVGAQTGVRLNVPGAEAQGVLDQLGFLSDVRRSRPVELGSRVVVIGAGNSAMDAARTAKRLVGKDGEVSIVYRRTRAQMPADADEIAGAVEEGVNIVELAAPERIETKSGRVTALEAVRMELGEPDESGRRSPIPVEGSNYRIGTDSVIVAIGQRVELGFLPGGSLNVDMETMRTDMDRVFAGGDAARGASSLIKAIGDGRRAAESIMRECGQEQRTRLNACAPRNANLDALRIKQARKLYGPAMPEKDACDRLNFELFVDTLSEEDARAEANRCLQCDLICNICTTVCPNRANMAVPTMPMEYPLQRAETHDGQLEIRTLGMADIRQAYQVINIADYCNECGNCATFCPTSGAPYRDKPRLHLSAQSFAEAEKGYHFETPTLLRSKGEHGQSTLEDKGKTYVYEDDRVRAEFAKDSLTARKAELKNGATGADLGPASEMMVLHTLLADRAPFAVRF